MKILFVCTGNTCRSPMAAGLARMLFSGNFSGNIEISSAGIGAWDGDPASPHAVEVMQEKGIDIKNHKAVKVTKDLLENIDFVITMTKSQEAYLRAAFPEYKDKIRRLGDWAGLNKDVLDPWGGSLEVYRQCASELEGMLKKMYERINREHFYH